MSRIVFAILLVFVVAATLSFALAQDTSGAQVPPAEQNGKPAIRSVPAPYSNPASGSAMYHAYCASCHGADARGEGPAAPALKTAPTNLTHLALQNGGVYPEAHVAAVIKGDALTAAHGDKGMPVWGPVFLSLGGERDSAQVALRIRNLVQYLSGIQTR